MSTQQSAVLKQAVRALQPEAILAALESGANPYEAVSLSADDAPTSTFQDVLENPVFFRAIAVDPILGERLKTAAQALFDKTPLLHGDYQQVLVGLGQSQVEGMQIQTRQDYLMGRLKDSHEPLSEQATRGLKEEADSALQKTLLISGGAAYKELLIAIASPSISLYQELLGRGLKAAEAVGRKQANDYDFETVEVAAPEGGVTKQVEIKQRLGSNLEMETIKATFASMPALQFQSLATMPSRQAWLDMRRPFKEGQEPKPSGGLAL